VSEPATTSPANESTELRIPALEGRARLRRYILIALALAGAVYAYVRLTEAPAVEELYRTVPVQRRSLVQAVEAAGRIDVESRVEVPAAGAGRIMAIHVHQGDSVQAGQLLAELDPRAAAQAAVEAAAGSVGQAAARRDEAQRNLERSKALLARGLASPADIANAEAQLKQAGAALEAARGEQKVASQTVASARLGQNLSRMESPAAGVVLVAPERVGMAVSPELGPVFVIGAALTTMRVDASVSETDVALIKPGQEAEILVSALPNESFRGKVQRISIEPERRDGAVLYPVRLSVENPKGALLPGMTARARMEVARADNVLSVHEAALRFSPAEAPEAPPRSRVWRRKSVSEVEAVSVRAKVSDGVYVEVEAVESNGGGATLRENDALAVGLLKPAGKSGPNVRLGDKKN
jgi:HlyD family secretion protein